MGFLDKLLGGSGRSLDNCPYCDAPLSGFGCPSCKVEFVMENGKLVEQMLSSRGSSSSDSTSCEMCQSSLSGGESYLPYEDGSNANAYIICPSCKHENIRYGFGGDDD